MLSMPAKYICIERNVSAMRTCCPCPPLHARPWRSSTIPGKNLKFSSSLVRPLSCLNPGRHFSATKAETTCQAMDKAKNVHKVTHSQGADENAPDNAVPIVIIGGGRIGRALLQMSRGRATLLTRGQTLAPPPDSTSSRLQRRGPIIVATHNSDLESVLRQVPESRWEDLVWLQGGMLLPWLNAKALSTTTQALLYMSALHKDPSDRDSEVVVVDGGGKSVVYGRWAGVFAQLLRSGFIQCSVVDRCTFYEKSVEKLLWACIFWLLCEAYGGVPCGRVVERHRQDVHDLTAELLPIGRSYIDSYLRMAGLREGSMRMRGELPNNVVDGEVHTSEDWDDLRKASVLRSLETAAANHNISEPFPKAAGQEAVGLARGTGPLSHCGEEENVVDEAERVVQELCEYSLAIRDAVPSVSMAMAEFDWRNGWFLKQAKTPLHVKWLNKIGLSHFVDTYS